MIIGLTGSYAAGKDTVADFLVKRGFAYYSLSDLLRKELVKQGKSLSRDNLIVKGNELRQSLGAEELARRIVNQIKKDGSENAVVVSIRNPEEVKFLKENSEFEMWFVDAPIEIRYERAKKRMRPEDEVSYDQFQEQEKSEHSDDPNHQQLQKVRDMADYKLENDRDEKSLYKKIEKLLAPRSTELTQ